MNDSDVEPGWRTAWPQLLVMVAASSVLATGGMFVSTVIGQARLETTLSTLLKSVEEIKLDQRDWQQQIDQRVRALEIKR